MLGVVADQAAKVTMQNVVGYRGYWGCSYCEFEGNFSFTLLKGKYSYIKAHLIFETIYGSFCKKKIDIKVCVLLMQPAIPVKLKP